MDNRTENGDNGSPTVGSAGRGKPYRAPRLVVYGDLRHLTMVKKASDMDDGPSVPKTKT